MYLCVLHEVWRFLYEVILLAVILLQDVQSTYVAQYIMTTVLCYNFSIFWKSGINISISNFKR